MKKDDDFPTFHTGFTRLAAEAETSTSRDKGDFARKLFAELRPTVAGKMLDPAVDFLGLAKAAREIAFIQKHDRKRQNRSSRRNDNPSSRSPINTLRLCRRRPRVLHMASRVG